MAALSRERIRTYSDEIDWAAEQADADLARVLEPLVARFRAASNGPERARWRSRIAEAYRAAVAEGQAACGGLADELFAEVAVSENLLGSGAAVHRTMDAGEALGRVRSVMACMFNRGWDDGKIARNLRATARASVQAAADEAMLQNTARVAALQKSLRYARIPADAETCGFCFMMSSRGFDLAPGAQERHNHPNCRCRAVPGFEGQTQVDGYDFPAMRERWRQCADTVGPYDERGRYDSERVQRECETRDPRWLWFGEEPRVGYDPEWVEYENETAGILGRHGFVVDPIPRSMERRRPDFALNGVEWEMKHPAHPGYMPVWNQFKKAVCGKSLHVRNPQSDKLVISNVRSGEDVDAIVGHVLDVANDEKDAFPEIKEVLVVSEKGIRRVKR